MVINIVNQKIKTRKTVVRSKPNQAVFLQSKQPGPVCDIGEGIDGQFCMAKDNH